MSQRPSSPLSSNRRSLLFGVLGVAAIAAAGFALVGPRRVWTLVGGPADQGPVDFTTLTRRSVANDSLACSPGTCSQETDFDLPAFRTPPAVLMRRLDAVAAAMAAERVDEDLDPLYRRYVFRSRVLGFPDTLDARASSAGDGETTLRLYSRSLLGRGDFGANRRRLRQIADDLQGAASVAGRGAAPTVAGLR
ncbi:DUF1499 domain-containing protein [Aurantimonas sp. 22II-16-19i]|uniref:DUF1499 domain-containing protein n=1 Tax=Aurantimonas sp. 22II-16-19i TaxID=1317114 RepID=UPI0009F7B375|nr:DUF1499 domain-containing protein [Aurantimonas sp. 22II-16-19i]ORE99044.1 hypothetical protein ATO4_01720 [Aurantimonas sp. 22II-16-19i]